MATETLRGVKLAKARSNAAKASALYSPIRNVPGSVTRGDPDKGDYFKYDYDEGKVEVVKTESERLDVTFTHPRYSDREESQKLNASIFRHLRTGK